MAGTIPGFSLAQQLDSDGTPLVGGLLYTIQAGTTSTPQIAYQDSGLTLPLPYPVVCDAYGRLPQIFLADGSIKLRLTRANGTQVFVLDGVLVVGASSGGGGGSPVDATTVIATGDLKARYGTGVLAGFVRTNGNTIGSATSGSTERANADCQPLFEYLWNADANLAVSTGRGATSAADWAANKRIQLPDWRGRAIAGLDDMGSTAAGRLTSTYFGTAATALGAAGGTESHTLTTAQLASHSHANTLTDPGHSHTIKAGSSGGGTDHVTQGDFGAASVLPVGPTGPIGVNTTGISINNVAAGSGAAHNNVQPTLLATIYIKL
jgi:microcystin-dependent protein